MKKLILFFAMMCASLVNAQEEQMPKGTLMNNPVPGFNWPYSQQYLIDDGQNLDQWYNEGWMVSGNAAEINNYQANTTYLLLSKTIHLPVLENGHAINLVFNESFELESYHDIGEILVSTDNGKSFECLSFRSGKGALRNTYINLNAYSGRDIMIAFRLETDQSHNFDGWEINNIVIRYDKYTSPSKMVKANPMLKSTSNLLKSTSTSEFVGLDANNFPNTVFAQAKIKDVNGDAILGLGNDDFIISERVDCSSESESGSYEPMSKKSPFMVYPPADATVSKPVDIVFLMDNSGSMSDEQNAVKNNVTRFVDSLESKGFDYSLAICKFGQGAGSGQPVLVPGTSGDWFNNDAAGFIQTWTDNMEVSGGTEPGYDALNHTAVNLSYRTGSQRLFIIITDEPNNGSNITDQNVILQNLQAQGINVYGILKSGSPTSSYSPLCSKVYDIFSSFTDILDDINTEINSTYTIRYEPKEKAYDSCEHHVKIGIDPDTSANFDLTGKSYIPGDVIDVVRTDETINRLSEAQSQGADIPVTVKVTDLHKPYAEKATLYYRVYSETNPNAFHSVDMSIEPSISTNEISYWTANIDSSSVKTPTVEYYVKASDGNQTVTVPGFDKALWNFAVIPNYPPELNDSTNYKPQQERYIDGETITFSVEAIDDDEFDLDGQTVQDAIDRVLLVYSHPSVVSPDGFETVEMTAQGNDIYTIDHVLQEGTTEYYFVAYDSYGSSTIYPVGADKNISPNTNMLSISAIDSSCVPEIFVPNVQACVGDTVDIVINTTDISVDCNYQSYEGNLTFDNSILEFIGTDITGTLSETRYPLASVNENTLSFGVLSFTPDDYINGSGALIRLSFKVISDGSSSLDLSDFNLNNHPHNKVANGQLTSNPSPTVSLADAETCYGHDHVFETAPTAFTRYSWSDGSTGATLITSQPGTYWVEVADNNGCKALDTAVLTTANLPSVSVSDLTVCEGDLDVVSISTGLIPDECDLKTFEFKIAFDGDVLDYQGYETVGTISDGFMVGVSQLHQDTIKVGVLSMAGDALTGSGELIRLQFRGQNAGNSDIKIGNFYYNAVENQNLTTGRATVLSKPALVVSDDQTICNGNDVLLVASGGTTYSWNTGSGASNILVSPLLTTDYTVTVTNVDGCINTDSVTVTVKDRPDFDLGADQQLCQGTQTTLSASNGTVYNWNTGANTESITVAPTLDTEYSVKVTNAFGCSEEDTVNLTVLPKPNAYAGLDRDICPGFNMTLSASGGESYKWSNGSTSSDIEVSPPATTSFYVTVTGANGCTDVGSVKVTVLTPEIVKVADVETCSGSTGIFDAGTGFLAYQWSNGDYSQTTEVNQEGWYSVTITGTNGCQNSDSAYLTVHDLPVVEVNDDTVYTNQYYSSPMAILDAGAGFNDYAWSSGEHTQTISSIVPGTYSVTVTDFNGCANSSIAEIVEIPFLYGDVNCDDTVTLWDAQLVINYANGTIDGTSCGGLFSIVADVAPIYGEIDYVDAKSIADYVFKDVIFPILDIKKAGTYLKSTQEVKAEIKLEGEYIVVYNIDSVDVISITDYYTQGDTDNDFEFVDAEDLSGNTFAFGFNFDSTNFNVGWIKGYNDNFLSPNTPILRLKYTGDAESVTLSWQWSTYDYGDITIPLTTTSVPEPYITPKDLRLYPVPVGEEATVMSPALINEYIITSTGSGIVIDHRKNINQNRFNINMDRLVPGHYVITFITKSGQRVVRQFVK